MTIQIGNAPCSWGVEFADDARNPHWLHVLDECKEAGYKGIELGPVGYMPEQPQQLADALSERDLELIGGVVFRPLHDANKWEEVLDGATRTCQALQAHGAQHLVLIDSISSRRAPTAGRAQEAEKMNEAEWKGYRERIAHIAKMGTEEYGLTVGIHPHAAGFMDFEEEVERLLSEIDASTLGICLDTGHSVYAGFNPVTFMQRHIERISYVHFKDIDPKIKAQTIVNRTDFYQACANGIFCKLGDGEVDFPQIHSLLLQANFSGWCTVEQDRDPLAKHSAMEDAKANRHYLQSIGFE